MGAVRAGTILIYGGAVMPAAVRLDGGGANGWRSAGNLDSSQLDTAIGQAVKQVLSNLSEVSSKSFLGMPYVNESAHSRHIQKSPAFAGYQQQPAAGRKL